MKTTHGVKEAGVLLIIKRFPITRKPAIPIKFKRKCCRLIVTVVVPFYTKIQYFIKCFIFYLNDFTKIELEIFTIMTI